MRAEPPNQFRNRTHPMLRSSDAEGMNGLFVLPNPKGASFPDLRCIISDGDKELGVEWEHVSVSTSVRCPTWDEMAYVKSVFFKDDEATMQLHVPVADHINQHSYCLHMWRPLAAKIPLPPKIAV